MVIKYICMKAKLITYDMAKQPTTSKDQLRMKLIGHTNKSHFGKYQYKRKGLLDIIPHLKPSRGTIIIPLKESDSVLKLLKEYKAKIKTFDITINKSAFKKTS